MHRQCRNLMIFSSNAPTALKRTDSKRHANMKLSAWHKSRWRRKEFNFTAENHRQNCSRIVSSSLCFSLTHSLFHRFEIFKVLCEWQFIVGYPSRFRRSSTNLPNPCLSMEMQQHDTCSSFSLHFLLLLLRIVELQVQQQMVTTATSSHNPLTVWSTCVSIVYQVHRVQCTTNELLSCRLSPYTKKKMRKKIEIFFRQHNFLCMAAPWHQRQKWRRCQAKRRKNGSQLQAAVAERRKIIAFNPKRRKTARQTGRERWKENGTHNVSRKILLRLENANGWLAIVEKLPQRSTIQLRRCTHCTEKLEQITSKVEAIVK